MVRVQWEEYAHWHWGTRVHYYYITWNRKCLTFFHFTFPLLSFVCSCMLEVDSYGYDWLLWSPTMYVPTRNLQMERWPALINWMKTTTPSSSIIQPSAWMPGNALAAKDTTIWQVSVLFVRNPRWKRRGKHRCRRPGKEGCNLFQRNSCYFGKAYRRAHVCKSCKVNHCLADCPVPT